MAYLEEMKTILLSFLKSIHKPIIVVFHTVLPHPDEKLKKQVQEINAIVDSFIVMTNTFSKNIRK